MLIICNCYLCAIRVDSMRTSIAYYNVIIAIKFKNNSLNNILFDSYVKQFWQILVYSGYDCKTNFSSSPFPHSYQINCMSLYLLTIWTFIHILLLFSLKSRKCVPHIKYSAFIKLCRAKKFSVKVNAIQFTFVWLMKFINST